MESDSIFSKMDEEEEEKVYYIFGHDISTISCFRSTMLSSISVGVATTLGSFLFTSNGFKSSRLGMLACSAIMIPLWLVCARKELEEDAAIRQVKKQIKERTGENYTLLDSLESIGSDSFG